jgi:hypothetical protein
MYLSFIHNYLLREVYEYFIFYLNKQVRYIPVPPAQGYVWYGTSTSIRLIYLLSEQPCLAWGFSLD